MSGRSSIPETVRDYARHHGVLDAPLEAGMTIEERGSAIPRRDAPEVCMKFALRKTEGAGNAGCPLHPQPRVQSVESTRVSHHRFTGTPGISCAMVLTAYFVLSPVTGLSCHRRLVDIGVSGPLGLTSPSTKLERQRRGVRTTRLRRPLSRCSSTAQGVHRIPHPTSVTIAIRPSCGDGIAKR
jgi:hypothetical protein